MNRPLIFNLRIGRDIGLISFCQSQWVANELDLFSRLRPLYAMYFNDRIVVTGCNLHFSCNITLTELEFAKEVCRFFTQQAILDRQSRENSF